MQHEIKNKGPLLNPDGTVREAGYATSLILDYDRKAIKANKLRIKDLQEQIKKLQAEKKKLK